MAEGVVSEMARKAVEDYDLYLFDIDGTLVRPKSGDEFRATADDWQWILGHKERVQELIAAGKKVALVTNQGGVGFGYFSESDMERELSRTVDELFERSPQMQRNCHVDVCWTHPKATIEHYQKEDDFFRKPNPGMLLGAMLDFHTGPQDTLMVGDRPEDYDAAEAAGCDFLLAMTFFEGTRPTTASL